jgi:hypothetical protein
MGSGQLFAWANLELWFFFFFSVLGFEFRACVYKVGTLSLKPHLQS